MQCRLPSVFSVAVQEYDGNVDEHKERSNVLEQKLAMTSHQETDKSTPVYAPYTNVYYTGLDPNANKEYVAQVFGKFGPIVDSKILIGKMSNDIFA